MGDPEKKWSLWPSAELGNMTVPPRSGVQEMGEAKIAALRNEVAEGVSPRTLQQAFGNLLPMAQTELRTLWASAQHPLFLNRFKAITPLAMDALHTLFQARRVAGSLGRPVHSPFDAPRRDDEQKHGWVVVDRSFDGAFPTVTIKSLDGNPVIQSVPLSRIMQANPLPLSPQTPVAKNLILIYSLLFVIVIAFVVPTLCLKIFVLNGCRYAA